MEIISRKEAKLVGKNFYYTGIPCKHGHLTKRVVRNSGCHRCMAIANLKNKSKKYPELGRKRRLRDPGRIRRRFAKDPDFHKRKYRRIRSREEAKQVAAAGRPKAVYCEMPSCNSTLKIVWDHDHKTGKFRGWICDRCNKVLGQIKDDPLLAEGMAIYLKRVS